MINTKCPSCGHENSFDQPYDIHAGFSNEGFLYSDQGKLTLIWSSFDPAYEAIVGKFHPWRQRTLKEYLCSDSKAVMARESGPSS